MIFQRQADVMGHVAFLKITTLTLEFLVNHQHKQNILEVSVVVTLFCFVFLTDTIMCYTR